MSAAGSDGTRRSVGRTAGRLGGAAFGAVMNVPELPMRWAQSRLRGGRLGWLFVAPNLAVFALFSFLPIIVDVWFAVTGGSELLPENRPFVGGENFTDLLNCGSYADPNSCTRDLFWYGVWNTLEFVSLQVGLMLAFSLVTALVLNRRIIGRSFFRAVFFYPVLLSPVVVALIWKWMLQPNGVLNAAIAGMGARAGGVAAASPVLGVRLDRVRQHLGAYGVLHADPAGRAASHPGGRSTRRRRWTPPPPLDAPVPPADAAAADAEPAGGAGALADPRRADLRRGVSC